MGILYQKTFEPRADSDPMGYFLQSCPHHMELRLDPVQKAYEFNRSSEMMTCSFVDHLGKASLVDAQKLIVRNHVIGSEIASKQIEPFRRSAAIR